ncbi:MAG TPA: hypothetical protein VIU61_11705 [Kofleriaceae bacterium]
MRWLVLVMAACSTSAPLEPPSVPVALGRPEPAVPLVLPVAEPLPPVITGVPGASIDVIAATEDGNAVVSSSGSLRLWPALDGTREPVVIDVANKTSQLAIERDGTGFAIARLDDTGTLELIRTTESGAVRARIAVASERPLTQVKLLDGVTLALTDDGALVRIAPTGKIAGRLLPPAGERIATVLVRRGRALALMESAAGVRGRWLAGVTWSGETAMLAVVPERAALSPDHQQVATTDAKARKITILELATGKRVATVITGRRHDFEQIVVVGFLGDGAFALLHNGMLELWRNGKRKPVNSPHGFFVTPLATDTRIISSYSHQLALADPEGTRYLGYQVMNPTVVRATPDGLLAATLRSVMRLDDQLVLHKRHQLGEAYSVLPVDDGRVLVSSPKGVDLVELATGKRIQRVAEAGFADYHPVTRLISIVESKTLRLGFYQPRTKRIGPLVATSLAEGLDSHVRLLDPAVSRGKLAVILERSFDQFEETMTLREIRAVKPGEELVEFAESRTEPVTKQDIFPITMRRKREDGHVVELGRSRVTLRGPDGKERWTIPAGEIIDAIWTPKGDLLVVGGGLGVLDVATGAFVRRQCGWEFKLTPDPGSESYGSATLCSRE